MPGPVTETGQIQCDGGAGGDQEGDTSKKITPHSAPFAAGWAFTCLVTPAYLSTSAPGREPEYMYPPSSVNCANITPDLLISPAANVLTNVSEVDALSLGGRSAFLMDGDFGSTIYYWLISDPNGDRGGMQLWWSQTGHTAHSCTVGINDAPPAALAQQGIRQFSSLAVPSVVNSEPVNSQVCLWYTVQKEYKQCSP
jgi:hypothetical protein